MNKRFRIALFFCLLFVLLSIAPVWTLLDSGDSNAGSIRVFAADNSATDTAEDGDISVSYSPVTGSYGSTSTPEENEVFFSGETFYFNIHVGKDFYVKSCSVKLLKGDGSGSTYKTYTMSKTGYGAYWAQKLSGLPVGSYYCSMKMVYYLRSNQKEQILEDEGFCPFVVTNVPTIKFTPSSLKMSKDSKPQDVRMDISTYWNLSITQLGLHFGASYSSNAFLITEATEKCDDENRVIYFTVHPLKTCKDVIVTFTLKNENNNNNVLATATFSVTIEEGKHTVTYDYATNGGSSATKKEAEYSSGSSVSLSPTASKSGWTFVGWNTDKNATSKLSSYTMDDADVTLYAIFKKTIKAKFVDYNGTTKRTNEQEVTLYNKEKERTITPPAQGSYSGWSSRGWSTSTSSGASPTNDFTLSSNTTYYGLYERSLQLSYNANGGKTTPPSSYEKQYVNSYSISSKKNPSITLANAISKDGYNFKSWAKGGTSGTKYNPGSSVSISEDTTMYAIWEAAARYVTYNYSYNGGDYGPKTTAIVGPGDAVDLSPSAEKEGWVFVGWNTDKTAKTKLTSLKVKDSDITLYAIFKKDITATFIDYSGTSKRNTKRSQTIYNNASTATVSAPSQGKYADWSACGWSTDTEPKATSTSSFKLYENTTFYGLYKRTVTLYYNANGGDSTPSSISGTQYANSYSITDTEDPVVHLAPAIKKSGVTFVGWAKDSKTGELYQAGDTITLTKNVSMYASFTNPKHSHSWGKPSWNWSGQKAEATFRCTTCGQSKKIQALVKEKVVKKATQKESGKVEWTAGVKNEGVSFSTKKSRTISSIRTIKIASKTLVYSDSVKTPKIVIKDNDGKTLKKDKDYKLNYSGDRIECGSYKAKVKFCGKYSGSKTLSFKIVLGQVKGLKQKKGDAMAIAWKPVTGADYYNVYCFDKKRNEYRKIDLGEGRECTGTEMKHPGIKTGTLVFKVQAVRVTESGKIVKGAFSEPLTASV